MPFGPGQLCALFRIGPGGWRKKWGTACDAVEVPRLLFHDLRRSAIRNLIRSGVPHVVAMEISDHRTREAIRATVRRLRPENSYGTATV
jgi:integrase